MIVHVSTVYIFIIHILFEQALEDIVPPKQTPTTSFLLRSAKGRLREPYFSPDQEEGWGRGGGGQFVSDAEPVKSVFSI